MKLAKNSPEIEDFDCPINLGLLMRAVQCAEKAKEFDIAESAVLAKTMSYLYIEYIEKGPRPERKSK